ncbi:PREDICTED: polycystic kidney disease 2-like 1 protein, partial [Priapulus caudatus]|uniref:Polycystic kidney disease 2-like 1 protein n=1 Tax=Priapulus caudatus TaxID=37621 RepID=A0ABM1F6X9_PRICU
TFGMTSSTMFYYTKVLSELFLDSQFNETRNNYRGMNQMMDCWRFAWEPMLNGLYWEKWYNGEPVNMTRSNGSFIFYENKILG